MDLELKGKVVVINGAAKGLGPAVTHAVAAEGATPVIVDDDVECGNRAHSQVKGSELIIAELASAESSFAVVDRVAHRFGRVDALVNVTRQAEGLPSDSATGVIQSVEHNVLPGYNMAHFALPYLKKSLGSIVNAISMPGGAGQDATRGAMMALTREWAAELAKHKIRVNAVVCEEYSGKIPQQAPEHRATSTPEQVAAVIVFLLSGRAAHITAQQIVLNPWQYPANEGL